MEVTRLDMGTNISGQSDVHLHLRHGSRRPIQWRLREETNKSCILNTALQSSIMSAFVALVESGNSVVLAYNQQRNAGASIVGDAMNWNALELPAGAAYFEAPTPTDSWT